MPIFNNEFTFIHIPKCGGSSIEFFLVNNGYNMKLFSSTGSIFINGHTPQHCTYRELEELNLLTDNIFTVVRPEIDRVISEYFWLKDINHPMAKNFNTFDDFLDLFLDKKNNLLFDNHNLSNSEFLINSKGKIDPKIKIFSFFDIKSIESHLNVCGLSNYHYFKTNKNIFITEKQKNRIKKFYDNKQ